jgi:hypothetical protein
MVSISMTLLQNTVIFGFIPICKENKVEECKCKIPGKGWILGVYDSLA